MVENRVLFMWEMDQWEMYEWWSKIAGGKNGLVKAKDSSTFPQNSEYISPLPRNNSYVSKTKCRMYNEHTQTCFIALNGACPLPTPKPIIVLKKKYSDILFSF